MSWNCCADEVCGRQFKEGDVCRSWRKLQESDTLSKIAMFYINVHTSFLKKHIFRFFNAEV